MLLIVSQRLLSETEMQNRRAVIHRPPRSFARWLLHPGQFRLGRREVGQIEVQVVERG